MRMIFGLVLIVGLGLAGFAVYMAQGYITQYEQALARERASNAPPIKLVPVMVAKTPLRYGQQLTPENVAIAQWPAEWLPKGAFPDQAALFPADGPARRAVLRAVEAGEPLLAVKLTDPGGEAGLTARLSKGMRAFAIRVDVASGVSGFLRPGDTIDVYWTGKIDRNQVTKLIQSGVRLIAVDQIADQDTTQPLIARTVTVEVTPQQVAALAQAQSTGRLSLSLLSPEDQSVPEVVQVDQRRLLGLTEESAPAPVEEKETCTVRTRRGSQVMEIPIPCTN
ncbi:Flp pilus assembly protein CpaB [Rhodovulum adriaticum]|uniref:Pilus assembly protein CpaB n=1 Tax=Rhodovulum adriaticum TaxID=35804 RepID=A0A4R2NN85_RHOAD|nr:Flp pilus assembly protein CpaB [Rhodovulum adriaticum]MBK1637133.1 Flp pilus assembly protein CpaB [Rhodovulum adriaticum]TCP22734.1 pilus assembly protein CpaB [Rhodovulum adriaticum]